MSKISPTQKESYLLALVQVIDQLLLTMKYPQSTPLQWIEKLDFCTA